MAGGSLAQLVPCIVCLTDGALTKASRVRDGIESDQYRCDEGHEFGMDWSKGPATEPLWPPPPELVAFVKDSE